jgi:serine protease Do
MENLTLATDVTLKDYCDILRTHNSGDTLAMKILRWDTQEVLEGQINGRPLEVSYAFGSPAPTDSGTTEASPTDSGTSVPANCITSKTSGFITCSDDTGNISVDVPDYWTDVNGGTWTYNDQDIGVAISAAPNLSDFQNYYNAEGVFFGASNTFAKWGGYVEFLDYYTDPYKADCTLEGRFNYNDGIYRGKYDQYSNCGGASGYDAYVLCAVDIVDPTSKIILVEIQAYPNDTATVNQIVGTFYVYF